MDCKVIINQDIGGTMEEVGSMLDIYLMSLGLCWYCSLIIHIEESFGCCYCIVHMVELVKEH